MNILAELKEQLKRINTFGGDRIAEARRINALIQAERIKQDELAEKNDIYLTPKQLKLGETYIVDARNFTIAKYTEQGFEGIRHKYGQRFLDTEFHWDQGVPYGTVKPIRAATAEEIQEWNDEKDNVTKELVARREEWNRRMNEVKD